MYGQTMNNDVTLSGGERPLLAGRYQVVRPLGAGGMGSVCLVEDTYLDNKQFAIKMLPSFLVSNKRAYRQLKDEALVAMKLVHPNIVQIRAFEENNGNPFLVMDYIEGQTLDDYLAENGTLSEEETIKLLKPIAAALDYAHGEGVVHRDVKPANVMIRQDGRPFVLDFGIAREIQETMTRVTGKLSSGTLLYMSPEQLNGAPPKKEQDVYSFAAMVYECLRGEPPFVRGQIEYQIVNTPPPPLPEGVSSWLSAPTMRGLAKKAEERPATCGEMFGGVSSVDSGGDKKYYASIAIKAYKIEDYSTAFEAAQKANQDDAEIQYILGRCYQFGDGVEENAEVALKWYYKAAVQGHADSLYELGCMYREITQPGFEFRETDAVEFNQAFKKAFDLGVNSEDNRVKRAFADLYVEWIYGRGMGTGYGGLIEVDETASRQLVKESAAGGFSVAQYELGRMYEKGDGVPQDYTSAFKWYRAAAEHGDQYSYSQKLGELYKKGLGVAKDYDEAIKWYRKAVDESSEIGETVYDLAAMYDLAKNYSEAVKWYRKAAERGMCSAQMRLGALYQIGVGVVKDDKEAFKWYLRAAEHDDEDNVQAQYEVGVFYSCGLGVMQNFGEAVKWYRKAAERGFADAQRRLGLLYLKGEDGVAKDALEAEKWYKLAVKSYQAEAEKDKVKASKTLGKMYYDGEGVAQDYKEAVRWFSKAVRSGKEAGELWNCADAQFYLAHCYCHGLGVSRDYIKAAKLYRSSASYLGICSSDAKYELGLMYFNGMGVPFDKDIALDLVRQAAGQKNLRAQICLGQWFSDGTLGVKQDYAEAFKWFKKASEKGNVEAQYRIGKMYYSGAGVAKDDAEAVRCFRKLAERNHIAAQYALGVMYYNGEGVAQDYEEAAKWLKKSATAGNADAQYTMGVLHENGEGVVKDDSMALYWYRESAAQGNKEAECKSKEISMSLAAKERPQQVVIKKKPPEKPRTEEEGRGKYVTLPPAPSDEEFRVGKNKYRVNGITYVDVSGMGPFRSNIAAFMAGLRGEGILSGWDRINGTWDAMKRSASEVQKQKRRYRS